MYLKIECTNNYNLGEFDHPNTVCINYVVFVKYEL